MSYMFNGCASLLSLNLSHFNTSKVTHMGYMFNNCISFQLLDISNFDTSMVTDMSHMFSEKRDLGFLLLSNFKTSKVTNMENMFSGCTKINFLNLSNFDTRAVTNMENMFSGCDNLTSLDISKFDTSSVKNMASMFNNCSKLSYFGLPYFNTSKDTNISDMFYGTLFLEYVNIKLDELNIIKDILFGLDIEEINKGRDVKIFNKNLMLVFTSTANQKTNEESNTITMDLGQCEDTLKHEYNISKNDSLYILQIIYEEEGMKIPKLEYQIYYPFYNNSNNMTKLNLSFCQDEKIIISIKVAINETIDKHNASSRYYNDPCYETKSEDGIDLSLKDRRDLFIINNMTLCEENCDLTRLF